MASVNFEKQKSATEAKAKMRHDATDERLKNDHQNEHIDKSKTHLNKSPSYTEMCQLYDTRIAELDATTNKNKRKDRVTLVSLEIPVPEHLQREKYDDWFNDVEECVKARYGDDNVLFRSDHYDEEHEYLDPEKNETVMSRVHTRFCVVPEKDGGLNAKWATSRSNMIQINNEIHEMTAEKYNCEFMDGTKRKSSKSVTALKNASNEAELEAREAEIARREQSVADYSNDIHDWELRLADQHAEFEEYKQQEETKLQEREADLDARDNNLRVREETTLKNEIRAKNDYSDAEAILIEARNILQKANDHVATMVAPPGLEEFCKTYKRRIAKTKMKDVGTALKPDYKRVYDLDKDGKKQYEEHNCYNDWQASLTAKRQSDRLTRELLDQADEMLAREKRQKSNFIDFEI